MRIQIRPPRNNERHCRNAVGIFQIKMAVINIAIQEDLAMRSPW
jgi:hypothetical protein